MSNLLSQRLRNAKKELTALKTAHKRGIGNLKVYKQTYDFSSTGSNIGTLVVTVNFSQSFTAYPFAYLLGYKALRGAILGASVAVETILYSNGGYTLTFTGTGFYYPGYTEPKVDIYSTSPITSVSHYWDE